jgi:hypothetical protein
VLQTFNELPFASKPERPSLGTGPVEPDLATAKDAAVAIPTVRLVRV